MLLIDKTGERFYHITVPWWGVIVGYIIAVSTFSIGGRYVSMFLMACGYAGTFFAYELFRDLLINYFDKISFPTGFALTLVWVSNAIPRPPTKRAAAIGIVNGFGNIGNLYVLPF